MKKNISRRDFLKTAGLMSLSLSIPKGLPFDRLSATSKTAPNILIIVFDAFSASNISLYGYPRDTTPSMKRLAQKAVVYHNHFSAGSFTTPGTGSLLTGVLPWTHRAFNLNETVDKAFVEKNIFHLFSDRFSVAYTHNPIAETLLRQFRRDITEHVPQEKLYLTGNKFINFFFMNDPDTARVAWSRLLRKDEGYAYSLFMSFLYDRYLKMKTQDFKSDFPRGFPIANFDNYYKLEDAIDWLETRLKDVPQPFLGYFHYLPPHDPYNTRRDFYNGFARDQFKPERKSESVFTYHKNQYYLNTQRTQYDEFILYVDEEFNRLFDFMEKSGILENTYVILTSDHGEMFERGINGHSSEVLYQPLVHIPLMIFEPGRTSREDIYSPTSAIDVLPTLLHWSNKEIPPWCEGNILPPFNSSGTQADRSIFTVQARNNDKYSVFKHATIMLLKEKYKLTYCYGYDELQDIGDLVELYDIQNDPEELENLYPTKKALGDELLAEVKAKLVEVNAPYERSG
jgi:arylsulfatase A-like enzyme